MTDITERAQIEERIAEQAALIDLANDAILVRGLDQRVVFWNRGAETLYGWSAEEAVGRDVSHLLYRHRQPLEEAIATVLEQGEWSGELEQLTRAGETLTVFCRWTLVRDRHGRPKSILAINSDITEQRRIERQLLRSQRIESLGTLAGGIAHDLNNVLAPILMSIGVLRLDETDPDRLELLETIEMSASRGASMVKQVLSFARGVQGERRVVDVAALVKEVSRIIDETFFKSIAVKVTTDPATWDVLGDHTQLHQVLVNLCVNARDAMPHGGRLVLSTSNVTLDAVEAGLIPDARAGRFVMLQVEDTGTGIVPEALERIFDPFYTTKELGKGTGLGLSTSLSIVRSHGGFIRVHSELRRGSRFRVYLPATSNAKEASPDAPRPLPRGRGELVLVVDDESAIRHIAQRTLEAHGYRVLVASDGAEAVAIFAQRSNEIAVVLTDMMMPVMDGLTTITVLLRLRADVRIIAMSGLGTDGVVAKAASAGGRHFISKPFTAETLLQELRRVLDEPFAALPPPSA